MFKKEQETTEDAYKREMARTGDATAKLQQAESRQVPAWHTLLCESKGKSIEKLSLGETKNGSSAFFDKLYMQFAAMERADKAESELAGLKGSAKQERLVLEAAIKRLEGELREAKQDAKLAERKSRQSLSQVDIGDGPFK